MEEFLNLDYYPHRLLMAWGTSILVGILGHRWAGWHASKATGLAIMTVPIWSLLLGYINTFPVLADPASILQPISPARLSSIYAVGIVSDLGHLGAGFLIWQGRGSIAHMTRLTPRQIAQRLRDVGLPMGGRSEAASIAIGTLAFPLLLAGTWLTSFLLTQSSTLQSGDESQVWKHMSLYHAIMISLSAGFGEELLYRGLLMVILARWMPAPAAVAIQAVIFGFAHAGYGTWTHVILPTLFGLIAGIAAYRYGIWSAIILHVLVDIYALGIEVARNAPWTTTVLAVLLILNTLATLVWVVRGTIRAWRRWRSPAPA